MTASRVSTRNAEWRRSDAGAIRCRPRSQASCQTDVSVSAKDALARVAPMRPLSRGDTNDHAKDKLVAEQGQRAPTMD